MRKFWFVAVLIALSGCLRPHPPVPASEPVVPVPKATNRCQEYVQDVRTEHFKYFGLDFPFWFGIGQLKAESNCRASVTAFDAGQGLAQFMPTTTKYVNELMGEQLDPYLPDQAIRMQAFYMHRLHKSNWSQALWLTYQAYNGGWGNLKAEYTRAGATDRDSMRLECRRKTILLKSGRTLNLCDVNYQYSKHVYDFGSAYATGTSPWRYW